ncbi:MAG: DUF6259 domain-containing protein [Verrucomicrobia bacterium]|nr:DUF6259 domain-containing protein [Verrucomicrobiota bacterium]
MKAANLVGRWDREAVGRWDRGTVRRWKGATVRRWKGATVRRWKGATVGRWKGAAAATYCRPPRPPGVRPSRLRDTPVVRASCLRDTPVVRASCLHRVPVGVVRPSRLHRFLWLSAAFALLTSAPALLAEVSLYRLTTGHLQVALAPRSGQLVELAEPASPHNLVGAGSAEGALWELELTGIGNLRPAQARRFDVSSIAGAPHARRWCWTDFGLPQAPDLAVTVTVRLDEQAPLSRWQIEVQHRGGLVLDRIRFPRLLNLPERPGERLAVPAWLGQETGNARAWLKGETAAARRLEWPYPGLLSLQCLALSNPGSPGLYVACDDPAGHLKDFAVFGGGDTGLNLEVLHRPEREAGSPVDYALPYAVIVGMFRGGWYEAAAQYRGWATNQVWARESRLRRGLVPDWVTNTALWVWNRGASPGVLEPAVVLQRTLGLPVSVFWHWWHGCAYDVGFPEYLPPREGEEAFRTALARAHQQDVRAIVYMNQRLWGMTTASWTNRDARRWAVKAADGQVHPEVYNTFTRAPCASMCMGTTFWRQTYADLASRAIADLGVDGIYMDQACSSLACFDPDHGHPLGGGTYWMEGFRRLATDIRARAPTHRGPALAGEGCGENWLPHLDLMLALQVSRERYAGPDGWEPIPFFPAVYHGYSVFYGNYSSLTMPPYDELWPADFAPREPLALLDRRFAQQFYLEQARAFVWGQQPTLANFRPAHLESRAEELHYVLRLARLHAHARDHLLHGTLLAPPKVHAPSATIAMSRLSIYAGQQGGLTEFRQKVPLALAAGWRAPDGTVAVALASLSPEASRPIIEVDAEAWGLPERGQVHRVDPGGRQPLGEASGAVWRISPALAPLDACLLELTPPAPP